MQNEQMFFSFTQRDDAADDSVAGRRASEQLALQVQAVAAARTAQTAPAAGIFRHTPRRTGVRHGYVGKRCLIRQAESEARLRRVLYGSDTANRSSDTSVGGFDAWNASC
jgi:hypothetical protein